jgi:XTP/dITP diphosphohydrolase
MLQLLLATRNAHKTQEFAAILGPGFAVSDLCSVDDFAEVEETGTTFEENARLKALAASRGTSGLVIADDSGLEVAALGGAPGVFSARYAGEKASDAENMAKLLAELRKVDSAGQNRAARFCCAIALARAGGILDVFVGTIDGAITDVPRGENGFGYDPVFVPNGYDATFAELGHATKNRISHRAIAIAKLRDALTRGGSFDS